MTITIAIRMLLILICSMIIGINRGKKNEFAGLNTHLFVSLGAGIAVLAPLMYLEANPSANIDPFRVAAQVVSGIGFLGAGTIIKSGQTIRGLTTAASLWTSALIAIGIASGAYAISIMATLLIYFFLRFSHRLDIGERYKIKSISISVIDFKQNFHVLNEFMHKNAVLYNDYVILEYTEFDDYTVSIIKYEIEHKQTHMSTNQIIEHIADFDFVNKIDSITEIERT
ncbi:MgtC/SapB family protein [Mollicutes bacterium LVI A0039]|nr:MgtC/SapB family protein [Mollicutes bacterium LVI A0039]